MRGPAPGIRMTARTSSTLFRFFWQAGGQTAGRLVSLASLVIAARELGLDRYGRFVVLLALLEACMIPWKSTVLQAAAVAQGRSEDGAGWGGTVARWWALGAIVLGGAATWFDGWEAGVALAACAAASALMFAHVPALIRTGRQRRFALGNLTAQSVRLALTVALVWFGGLTPIIALLAVGGGSLAGAAAMWVRSRPHTGTPRWYVAEASTEAMRWTQAHAPILVVALVLGLGSAGGFDILYKIIQALVQLLGGIGVLMLPAFLRPGESSAKVLARSLRLPTVLAVLAAAATGLLAGPVLEAATGSGLPFGLAPLAFAPVVVLAPWMGVSWTALVVLGGPRWLVASQSAVSAVSVGASFLAVGGVVWAAVAISAASLIGSGIRWLGLRSFESLPPAGWLAPEAWRSDAAWVRAAVGRRGAAHE